MVLVWGLECPSMLGWPSGLLWVCEYGSEWTLEFVWVCSLG